MTKVDFYFDPACPFCWITSRWLLMVSEHRQIDITWRPFSLAMKNDSLVASDNENSHAPSHRASHRVLRVMFAANEKHSTPLIDLYTLFGIKHHIAGFGYSDEWISNVLEELDLPTNLLAAADDVSYDEKLKTELQSALDVVGNDVGVPIIVFDDENGDKQGYFGPVLNEQPELDEALDIWDGLEKLGSVKSFYELKRTRPGGGPNTASSANAC